MKSLIIAVIYLMAMLGTTHEAMAQALTQEQELALKSALESQAYNFIALTVIPLAGGERELITHYSVSVSKDSVVCDLPYIGQSYTAPTTNSYEGIKFSSTKFDYKLSTRKKGGWDISIRPKDIHDNNHINISIYKNGTVYCYVTNTNRQSISFSGYIMSK